eukprot:gene52730-23859_t
MELDSRFTVPGRAQRTAHAATVRLPKAGKVLDCAAPSRCTVRDTVCASSPEVVVAEGGGDAPHAAGPTHHTLCGCTQRPSHPPA